MTLLDILLDELPFIAFGALLVIVVQILLRLGTEFLGDRNSYERRWSRMQRAQRRERERLAREGTP